MNWFNFKKKPEPEPVPVPVKCTTCKEIIPATDGYGRWVSSCFDCREKYNAFHRAARLNDLLDQAWERNR